MTRASTGKFQWLHSYLPPWRRTSPIPVAAQGPSTNKKQAKRSTTVDGCIVVIISPFFLFRTYLCTYFVPGCWKGIRYPVWLFGLGGIHMYSHGFTPSFEFVRMLFNTACFCMFLERLKQTAQPTIHFPRICAENSGGEINWSKHVKVASKKPKRSSVHWIPYCTILNCLSKSNLQIHISIHQLRTVCRLQMFLGELKRQKTALCPKKLDILICDSLINRPATTATTKTISNGMFMHVYAARHEV